MKKIIPVLLVIVVALFFFLGRDGNDAGSGGGSSSSGSSSSQASGSSSGTTSNGGSSSSGSPLENISIEGEELDGFEDVTPAPEAYTSAEQALDAIRGGAETYDDLVLEQFVELGDECVWCDKFYSEVKTMMTAPDATEDQRSYYAEVLAISGRKDNVESLVTAIENADNEDNADLYMEALEVTMGKDDTVEYLGTKLKTDNDLLQESVLAALTNHGSRLAVDTLYKQTLESGDPDGYYSLGIGLGEVIPDEESMPRLTELVNKRDQYSHLAVKSLLNAGPDGLRLVLDALENSSDADFDRQMLEDAVDHVSFEDETEELLKKALKDSKNPVVVEFAKTSLEDFEFEEEVEEDLE